MRLYTFEAENGQRIGVEHDERIIDLSAAHNALLESTGQTNGFTMPSKMLNFLQEGNQAMEAAQAVLDYVPGLPEDDSKKLSYDMDEIRILAPVPRPGKMLCSGINYYGHLEEEPGATLTESPWFFSKVPSVVVGPGDPIIHPKLTEQLDYEVELAIVIGRTARNVPESDILDYVAGYTVVHDVSARDVQFKDSQITLGKNFDSFAPMGPCIVTPDEIPDVNNLRLRAWVNDELLIDSSTDDWVFPLPTLLSSLAAVMTLEPGDVVTTGCPKGVGVFRDPPIFLHPGDVTVIEVEGVGRLENPVVAEA